MKKMRIRWVTPREPNKPRRRVTIIWTTSVYCYCPATGGSSGGLDNHELVAATAGTSNFQRGLCAQVGRKMVEPCFLRIKQVLELIPVGKSSFWHGVRTGKYPKGIKLGPRTTVWDREEIYNFIANANANAKARERGAAPVIGGCGDKYHTLMRFDLTELPTRASSVRLELFADPQQQRQGAGTTKIYLDRITEFWDWKIQGTGQDRERLWWADRPAAVQWFAKSLPAPIIGKWYSIEITKLYNGWQDGTFPNYGLQLRPVSTDNRWVEFYSSDYTGDPSLRPRLVVVPVPE